MLEFGQSGKGLAYLWFIMVPGLQVLRTAEDRRFRIGDDRRDDRPDPSTWRRRKRDSQSGDRALARRLATTTARPTSGAIWSIIFSGRSRSSAASPDSARKPTNASRLSYMRLSCISLAPCHGRDECRQALTCGMLSRSQRLPCDKAYHWSVCRYA